MFDLTLRFQTFEHFAQFLALFLVNTLFVYINCKKSRFSLTPFILINLLFLAAWGIFIGLDRDETEHLHCAWLISQGLIPYKDFWQHHLPLLWVLLAPLFKLLKSSVFIFSLSRILSAFIFTAIAYTGWQIAKKVWQQQAKLPLYLLLVLSTSILGEFLWIRPDLLMVLFLLTGLYFTLEIPNEKISPIFFAGASFAMAASFMPKEYLLFLLPIVLIIGRNRLPAYKLLVYGLGFFTGSLPLLLYVIKNNILKDLIFWVLEFNQRRIVIFNVAWSATFPVAIALIGILGAYLLLSHSRKLKDKRGLIIVAAFCLSTSAAFSGTVGKYYLQFWLILCAILGCGWNIRGALERLSSLTRKSLLGGLFFSLLIFPNFFHGKTHIPTYLYEDKKVISKLMEYCKNDSCFLILPQHSIFSYDATGFYSETQFDLVNTVSRLKHYAKDMGMAEAILHLKPAAIIYKYDKLEIILYLYLKNLISREDSLKLRALLNDYYSLSKIGSTEFYIRKDKILYGQD
jgi:hypothetical protein